jgi:NAD(P)-dependent dehydrogenase (short-subunit alcohol dehydrogenase family)
VIIHPRFAGRVAIVTGASRGIGAALASALAEEGAAVACAARTEQTWNERLPGTIHETVEAIRSRGGRALAVRCDLTIDDDIVNLVETVSRELGPVDILVNNAAVTAPGRPPSRPTTAPVSEPNRSSSVASTSARPHQSSTRLGFLDFPLKGYRLHFEVDVFSSYRLMQLVLPAMIEMRRGAILNITSDASRRPAEGPWERAGGTTTFAYGGAKAALEHLTRAVAFEVQSHNIGVNALMPSLPIATPGLRFQSPDPGEEGPMADFCEAALRLLAAPPSETTGYIAYSEDVLHPELGRRGWLGQMS